MANRPRAGRLSPAERAVEARRLRDADNLSQREIAERLDVSPSTIAKDLRGADPAPIAGPSASVSPEVPSGPSGFLGALLSLIRAGRSLIGAGRRRLP